PDRSRERPTPAEMAQKIAAAEARAFRDGYDAGQREAKAESDRRTALALEEIQIAMQGIAARFGGIERRMETEAVEGAGGGGGGKRRVWRWRARALEGCGAS